MIWLEIGMSLFNLAIHKIIFFYISKNCFKNYRITVNCGLVAVMGLLDNCFLLDFYPNRVWLKRLDVTADIVDFI